MIKFNPEMLNFTHNECIWGLRRPQFQAERWENNGSGALNPSKPSWEKNGSIWDENSTRYLAETQVFELAR